MPYPKKADKIEPGIWKTVDGRVMVDFKPGGRTGKRFTKLVRTQGEARELKRRIASRYERGDALVTQHDNRTLSQLSDDWFRYHGHTLASGKKRLGILHNMCRAMGDPQAKQCKAVMFLDYRQVRIEAGITANHMNHELAYLKAVFNVLSNIDNWKHDKPFDKIKKLKLVKKQLRFLSTEEQDSLLSAASESENPDLHTVIETCLSTGCRFGEINGLEAEHVRPGIIDIIDSKNGRNRSVPIGPKLEQRIREGRPKSGKLFRNCFNSFDTALAKASITLPRGQNTHVLRHTFASHYMMNGGPFLELNKILGHETVQMTLTYAHLAPQHLVSAIKYNPLDFRNSEKK